MNTEHKSQNGTPVRVVPRPVLLDEECIPSAEAVLAEYKERGVILESDGEACGPSLKDNVFYATNQLSLCVLDFSRIEEEAYDKNWSDFFGISFSSFLMGIKCGVFFLLGALILPSLRALILDFVCFVSASREEAGSLKYRMPRMLLDILLRLPVRSGREEERDRLAFTIEDAIDNRMGGRRSLPDFLSIFTFDSILRKYWASDKAKKALYYPVYLWWTISGIVPLRPIEFLVTPWECVTFKGGEWKLTLRRSRLKGGSYPVSYRISQDFSEHVYTIPEKLAQEILEYKKLADPFGMNPLGTLLSSALRCAALGIAPGRPSSYYTYSCLVQDIRLFHMDVIASYGYETAENEEQENEYKGEGKNCVRLIRPGDTRHLAAINLVESGTPLQTAQLIMVHNNTNTTSHYSGNLNAYTETAVKSSHRMESSTRFSVPLNFSNYGEQVPEGQEYVEMDEGRCYSPKFRRRSAEDCIMSVGPGGRWGWCASCGYFRNNNPDVVFTNSARYLEDANENWKLLLDTIEHYRKDYLGMGETLSQALARAKGSLNIIKNLMADQVEKKNREEEDGED